MDLSAIRGNLPSTENHETQLVPYTSSPLAESEPPRPDPPIENHETQLVLYTSSPEPEPPQARPDPLDLNPGAEQPSTQDPVLQPVPPAVPATNEQSPSYIPAQTVVSNNMDNHAVSQRHKGGVS